MQVLSKWLRAVLLPSVAMLTCGGCVTSDQPLSAIKEAKPDLRLVGHWHTDSDELGTSGGKGQDARITFDEHGQGCMAIQQADGSWNPGSNFPNFFVTRTAKASYLNLYNPLHKKEPDAAPEHGKYLLIKYRLSDDQKTLTYWTLNTKFFQQAVADGKLKGRIKDKHGKVQDDVVLLDSSEAMLHFIELSLEADIYTGPATATRVP